MEYAPFVYGEEGASRRFIYPKEDVQERVCERMSNRKESTVTCRTNDQLRSADTFPRAIKKMNKNKRSYDERNPQFVHDGIFGQCVVIPSTRIEMYIGARVI
jgi:hypothetical protein